MKIPTTKLIILSALLLITYHPFAQKEVVKKIKPNLNLLGTTQLIKDTPSSEIQIESNSFFNPAVYLRLNQQSNLMA